MPLEDFLLECPLDPKGQDKRSRASGKKSKKTEPLYVGCPAMQDHLNRQSKKARVAKDGVDIASTDGGSEEEEDFNDSDIERCMDELSLKRAEEADAMRTATEDFKVELLGGPATKKKKGIAFSGFKGSARGFLAERFCEMHGLDKTFGASFAEHTEAIAGIVCRAWCHKLQYYFDIQVSVFIFRSNHSCHCHPPVSNTSVRTHHLSDFSNNHPCHCLPPVIANPPMSEEATTPFSNLSPRQ